MMGLSYPNFQLESKAEEIIDVTIEQLEERLGELERQVAALKREINPLRPLANVQDTFGMFAGDPDFDEIVRLGREYRQQVNSEDNGC
jgi:archaellum component FlaC